jgi:hypothetical protein
MKHLSKLKSLPGVFAWEGSIAIPSVVVSEKQNIFVKDCRSRAGEDKEKVEHRFFRAFRKMFCLECY